MNRDATATVPQASVKSKRKRRMSPSARREELMGWLMASPWIVGVLLFTAFPFGAAAYLSLTEYDVLRPPVFVGLANFREMFFEDPLFWQSLKITTIYSVVSVPLSIALGLFLALLLKARIHGLAWLRTVYYLPAVLSGVAVSILWAMVFNADWGVLNHLLGLVGIEGPAWLQSEKWVMPAMILMSLWGVGGGLVIYLAGLQGIPTELYEAAQVDGAGLFRKFWHITIPMLSPVLLFQLIMGIIGALQTFTQGYVMTSGGPNNASLFYQLYLWREAFQLLHMGYASALAWGIFVYILVLTLLVLRSSQAWVFYMGEIRGR